QLALPLVNFVRASAVLGPIRIVKDAEEIDALAAAAGAVDAIDIETRTRPFIGRSELDIHRELVDRMLAAGHERANFPIVAGAAHTARPHHAPAAGPGGGAG